MPDLEGLGRGRGLRRLDRTDRTWLGQTVAAGAAPGPGLAAGVVAGGAGRPGGAGGCRTLTDRGRPGGASARAVEASGPAGSQAGRRTASVAVVDLMQTAEVLDIVDKFGIFFLHPPAVLVVEMAVVWAVGFASVDWLMKPRWTRCLE